MALKFENKDELLKHKEEIEEAGRTFLNKFLIDKAGNEEPFDYIDIKIKNDLKTNMGFDVDLINMFYQRIETTFIVVYKRYSDILNDFDRQSLKLISIINDMYIVEKEIYNLNFIKNNKLYLELQSFNKTIDEYVKQINAYMPTKEQTNVFNEFLDAIKKEKGIMNDIQKSIETTNINKLKKDDNYIGNCLKDDSVIGLLEIIYNSLVDLQSLYVLLDAMYNVLKLKERFELKKFYELTSYSALCKRINLLLELAKDNNSLDKEFLKSKTDYYLNDYLSLKDKIGKIEKSQIFKEEEKNLENNLKEYLDLENIEKFLNVNNTYYEILTTIAPYIKHLKAELGW